MARIARLRGTFARVVPRTEAPAIRRALGPDPCERPRPHQPLPTTTAWSDPVPPSKLARNAIIVKVRINGGQVLRLRCVGDGCDWRRRRRPQILASISELDRVFHSHAPRVSLRVTIRRR